MLDPTEIAGLAGAVLAGAAYVPQISHLIKARSAAGISRPAFALWLIASLLITVRAVAIGAGAFIALGTIQIMATALIMRYATRYKDKPSPAHTPAPLRRVTVRAGPARSCHRPETRLNPRRTPPHIAPIDDHASGRRVGQGVQPTVPT